MNESERAFIEHACTNLSISYARHVDFKEYDQLTELFEENAQLITGAPLVGKESIRKALHGRTDKLRSRHVLTNIYVEVIDQTHAKGITYLTLYRHIGPESLEAKPILLEGPAAVGHYSDDYILTDTGWCFARRELEFAFQNPGAFTRPKK
ncbi:MAG TPA: nuclear transport factor 2 family protein [Pseudomonadales bacterium]|mgnify:CR=1 FL=1|jgi:hypothetical protein|nr:hypothetical protein [Gammaproteobacteria bacterium]MDP6025118.1 nuclear transport factor 2 family protein [Pseudomonadales bacterium]MDP6315643.1 nuclear transport factor 2 family protein [Pseudomonadales bacterium]MDP7313555.1 nuclear transport factor 2 family protein [Pseudomonadales bacterium]MDP7576002.1 nuclear transport factor 2 family protein [Pseudomonadales bacterium]|tara:strand:- start:766 stop:1218 length:453 start_codon:yes stop_codon:yes gene_type:complete